ncbi:MAG: hypothetical protein NFCOHLIN_02419 [Gammaproteobacteria bacterium]|nr:hypothetical protein [Gammaproteobacteria bacterium]
MKHIIALGFSLVPLASPAAEPAPDLLARYAQQAARENPAFNGFSAERGRTLFTTEHPRGADPAMACASCHTADPQGAGEHRRTGKRIKPLAPSANPERLSNAYKVEKWFTRNCQDVLQRQCSALEKGDVMTWLLSIK